MFSSTKYIPPINFGYVEENLYRSGQPNALNFPYLEKLGLKKILYLAPDAPNKQFENFIKDQEIELIHLGAKDHSTNQVNWGPISEETVLASLEMMLNPANYPLAVMCNMGRHRTGTVIGCFRKLQRWNLTSILSEYRRFAGNKVRVENEQFIELFDTDLVKIPENKPPFL